MTPARLPPGRTTDLYALLPSAWPQWPELTAAISLQAAGTMRGGTDIAGRYLRASRLGPGPVYRLRQVHSRQVLVATGIPERLALQEADGLISEDGRATLGVTVADCLPIFLADPVRRATALVHSGWRGTGIAVVAAALLTKAGSRRGDLGCVIGPGIGACCYRVDGPRAAGFANAFGTDCVRRDGRRAFLDLRQANLNVLRGAGLSSVTVVGDCTECSPRLYSFRKDVAAGLATCRLMLATLGPERSA